MSILGETMAAIATAPGRGGVAIVRVSGPDAFALAERLTGRRVEVGRIVFSRLRSPTDGRLLDEAVVLAFRAPRSYTGEDVIEFQCHGGSVAPRRVLEACFAAGARLARRGEFTERAFLSGRIDYAQAESVLDLVDAKTARAADAALEGLSGRRRQELADLYEDILSLSVEVEHALDVDEGELPGGFLASLASRLARLAAVSSAALARAHEGRLLREGALVVLAGEPNAGKSSLMNALLEENRAIVSDVPGTTRDAIEAWLDLGGWPIRLVDTAGLRATGDAIEAEGVRRAEDLIASADVVIRLEPAGAERLTVRDEKDVPVVSKCDLARGEGLNVSVRTGEGLDALKREIVRRVERRAAMGRDAPQFDDERLAALTETAARLAALRLGDEGDLVVVGNGLRDAAERLGALIGATYSENMLDRLFSRFCVGK